jgi:hypothetical protein
MIEEAWAEIPWYVSIWGQSAMDDTNILRRLIEIGGHVKLGLELFYGPGRNSPDLELIRQVQEIARDVGRPIATWDEALAFSNIK